MRSSRSALVVGVLASALLLVTGCGSQTAPTALTPAELKEVKVSGGDAKTAPTLSLPQTPFTVDQTRVAVLKDGDGAALTDKDIATVDIALFNGRNGAALSSSFEKEPGRLFLGQPALLVGLRKSLVKQTVGSRVLIAVPPADGFGGQGASGIEVGPTDTMLFVVDVIGANRMLDKATGKNVTAKKDLPKVTWNADKAATVTIPKGLKAPATSVVQPLIAGTGPKVAANKTVRVTYTGVLWRNGEKFDSSFDHAEKYFEFPTGAGQVIKAWDAGVIGQKVGSRLLLVVPPADGYGAAGSGDEIKGTDTLVYVIDILGAY